MSGSNFTCLNNKICPCRDSVEYDILKGCFFIIECPDCKKVYMSGKGRRKLRVFHEWEEWKGRNK